VLALVAAVLVAAVVVSGFLSNLAGPLDYLRSYLAWVPRGAGTELHKQPWHYYLSLLTYTHRARGPVWSEGLIVGLAVVGLIAGLLGSRLRLPGMHPGLVRFLSLYTLTLTALYALIPYKTPWCLLSFLQGMILLAGVGAAALTGALRPEPPPASPRLRVPVLRRAFRGALCLLLLAAASQLAWQSYGTSYLYPTDGRNPYAYAQTVPDIVNLGTRVNELGAVSPQRDAMVIKVFSVDRYYWPLPWYLRRFPNVGYWTEVPADADAPVVICSPEFDEELIRRLDATHLMTGYFGLRPKVLLEVWVRMDLWEPYIMGRQKAKAPGGG
jgi:predicted membrane-bound mannosyltransferase